MVYVFVLLLLLSCDIGGDGVVGGVVVTGVCIDTVTVVFEVSGVATVRSVGVLCSRSRWYC